MLVCLLKLRPCREGAEDSSHWAWQRRPRLSMSPHTEEVVLTQGSASLPYGWEYLGAGPRAVMTPSAELAQLSLASAIHMHMGALVLGRPSASAIPLACDCVTCRWYTSSG